MAMGSKKKRKGNNKYVFVLTKYFELFRQHFESHFSGPRHRFGMRCCHFLVASAGLMTVFLRRLQKFF